MNSDTRIALFLMGELIYALRANDPDLFRQWLSGGVQDLGEPVVEELLRFPSLIGIDSTYDLLPSKQSVDGSNPSGRVYDEATPKKTSWNGSNGLCSPPGVMRGTDQIKRLAVGLGNEGASLLI